MLWCGLEGRACLSWIEFARLRSFRVWVDLGGCWGLEEEVEGQLEGGSDGGREEAEVESV